MLSIGIPIYNQDVRRLVHTLLLQCQKAAIDFEIICLDDASNEEFKVVNRTLEDTQGVCYLESPVNEGRATTRNKIAAKATYDYLLYLDSDVRIHSNDFINRYLTAIHQGAPVVVGGIEYNSTQVTPDVLLHYQYGMAREAKPASVRSTHPYSSFLTGNLMIRTALIQKILFLSTLKEYGHEDTLLCLALQAQGIPVVHIDNPVEHEGLEPTTVFISKHLTAVGNLAWLMHQGYDMSSLKISATYLRLKKWLLHFLFAFLFGLIRHQVYRRLATGRTTNLVLFDMLRLYELHQCAQQYR